ncbi:hypothetical protein [Saccharothrix saharensis]|uniref:hypothetical protein n=1 Tax=Saccharothrix saharensis TaxID=571190 RepID=UPI00114E8B47|nr:hypothetical protein [Saccharothrix saharensis]
MSLHRTRGLTAAASVTVRGHPAVRRDGLRLDIARHNMGDGNASVTPVVTDATGTLVRGKPVRLAADRSATLTVPAKSVTTFVVDGVVPDPSPVQLGHVYALTGVQSGKPLAPTCGGTWSE